MFQKLMFLLFTFGLVNFTAQAQGTGPGLPKPLLLPAAVGQALVKTATQYDSTLQKYQSTHVIEISGSAAIPLFNSLEASAQSNLPKSKVQQEIRVGRNVKCTYQTTAGGRANYKAVCELTTIDGEYLDITLMPTPAVDTEKSIPTKTTTATVKVQTRPEGVAVTITGILPKELGADEIYSSLENKVVDISQSTLVQTVEIKTMNMVRCVKTTDKHQVVASCTTIFNKGVALIP